MGASASTMSNEGTSLDSYGSAFAIAVVKDEYESIKKILLNDDTNGLLQDDLINSKNHQDILLDRLKYVYHCALGKEIALFSECIVPVIRYRYKSMTDQERHDYISLVIAETIEMEHRSLKQIKIEDFSNVGKSFGGSVEDSKNEREAAKLLRGEGGCEHESIEYAILKPGYFFNYDSYTLSNIDNVWIKHLSNSGCYIYINAITRAISSITPSSYSDNIFIASKVKEESVGDTDVSNNLPIVKSQQLVEEIQRILDVENKTPFLIDGTKDKILKDFFSFKSIFVDISVLTIPFAKSGLKRDDVLEGLRKKLLGAMKAGTTFAFYMGDCTRQQVHFKNKFCKKDYFPIDVFYNGGKKLFLPLDEPRFKLLLRTDDAASEDYDTVISFRDGFKVVVISLLSPYEYEADIDDSLPLGCFYPLFVVD